jgi:hypothetical protein
MKRAYGGLLICAALPLAACGGRVWGLGHEKPARFALTGLRRTGPNAQPQDLILRTNVATGETWVLAAVEKDGKVADRWARVLEPIKETRKLQDGKEITVEEEVEAPH